MSKPTIHYFPLRGRAEVMRLALVLQGVDYVEQTVDHASMKQDAEHYPFSQCPRYVDGDIDLVQSNAIMRFIGRKYGLMGSTEKEHCLIDMVMEGVESLRSKYVALIYQHQLSDEAKAAYCTAHLERDSLLQRNGGAHMGYLANLLSKSSTGFMACTPTATMADLALWDIVDLHMRIFPDELKAQYPNVVEFHAKVAAIPNIKAYLAGPKRKAQVNANNLG